MVDFSVRAQDFILKKGLRNYSQSIDFSSLQNQKGMMNMHDAEVNNYLDSNMITSNKSPRKSDLMLPTINKNA